MSLSILIGLTYDDVVLYREFRSKFTNTSKTITQDTISDLIEVYQDPEAGIYEKLKDKTRSEAISDVKQVWKNWISDNARDSDLAKKFHYSNEYTSRLIKELTGMNYTEILRTVRIEHSQDLLANSTMSVATIAEAIGYDTSEHYIRQFKKHTGMTPSAFRKQSASSRNK